MSVLAVVEAAAGRGDRVGLIGWGELCYGQLGRSASGIFEVPNAKDLESETLQSITRWRIKREVTGRVKWEGFEKDEHVCLTKVENWLIDKQICQYHYTDGKRIKMHKED